MGWADGSADVLTFRTIGVDATSERTPRLAARFGSDMSLLRAVPLWMWVALAGACQPGAEPSADAGTAEEARPPDCTEPFRPFHACVLAPEGASSKPHKDLSLELLDVRSETMSRCSGPVSSMPPSFLVIEGMGAAGVWRIELDAPGLEEQIDRDAPLGVEIVIQPVTWVVWFTVQVEQNGTLLAVVGQNSIGPEVLGLRSGPTHCIVPTSCGEASVHATHVAVDGHTGLVPPDETVQIGDFSVSALRSEYDLTDWDCTDGSGPWFSYRVIRHPPSDAGAD